jgi:hypothetical protein
MTVQTAPEFRIPYFYVDGDITGVGGRGDGETALEISGGEYQTKGKLHREKDKVELGNKKNYFHLFASSSLCKFAGI